MIDVDSHLQEISLIIHHGHDFVKNAITCRLVLLVLPDTNYTSSLYSLDWQDFVVQEVMIIYWEAEVWTVDGSNHFVLYSFSKCKL
jgi:hypothetical protein